MNEISVLTREIVAEYESLIGRKLTPSEYLGFRNQAMMELNSGYSLAQSDATNGTPVVKQNTMPIMTAAPVEPKLMEPKPIEPKVMQQSAPNIMASIKPTIQPVASNMAQENDPFFSMIDNMNI